MSSNFATFSPNCLDSVCANEIKLVQGDDLLELKIHLQDSECTYGSITPPELEDVDLTNYQHIYLRLRERRSKVLVATMEGVGVAPLVEGRCIIPIAAGTTENLVGKYDGEIEVVYQTGRILTVYDLVAFDIREDFT